MRLLFAFLLLLAITTYGQQDNKTDKTLQKQIRDLAQAVEELKSQQAATGEVKAFASIARLKASPLYKAAQQLAVRTIGYYTPGDGGGADYWWVDTCTHTPDDAFYIKPAAHTGKGAYHYVPRGGVYNVVELGAKRDLSADAAPIIQKAIDAGTYHTVEIPAGQYFCSRTIKIIDKQMILRGTRGTVLNFPAGVLGLQAYRVNGPMYSTIQGLTLQATGKAKWDGYANMQWGVLNNRPATVTKDHWYYATDKDTFYRFNGKEWITGTPVKSTSENDYKYHGMLLSAVLSLKEVNVSQFSGIGILIYAAISDKNLSPAGTDASGSSLQTIMVASNDLHGIWVVGPDANVVQGLNIDLRDNKGWGLKDQSFLGCNWKSVMCHYNGQGFEGFGDLWCMLPTTASTFKDCYTESRGDGKISRFHDGVIVQSPQLFGGYVGGQQQNGAGITQTPIGGIYPDHNQQSIYFGHMGSANDLWRLAWGNTPTDTYSGEIGFYSGALSFHPSRGSANAFNIYRNGSHYKGRPLLWDGAAAKTLMINGRSFFSVDNLSELAVPGSSIAAGDIVYNKRYNGRNNYAWIAAGGGTYKTITVGAKGQQNGPTIRFHGVYNVAPGEVIIVNGDRYTLVSTAGVRNELGGHDWYTYPEYSKGAEPLPVVFATPVFRAIGTGVGTRAERPQLRPDDAGFQYFDTTLSQWITWLGNRWKEPS